MADKGTSKTRTQTQADQDLARRLAAQKAAELARLKALELAKQQARQRASEAAKRAEKQTVKNVPTVVTQDILNKLREGDMKSVLDVNKGISKPLVGQTLNMPTVVGQSTTRNPFAETNQLMITNPLVAAGKNLPTYSASNKQTSTVNPFQTGMKLPFTNKSPFVKPQQNLPAVTTTKIHTYKPDFSNSNRAGTGAHGDTFVPPTVEMRAPEEIDTILTNAASGFDQDGNPAKFPDVLYGEEMRATYGDLYLNYSKMLIDSGYVYDRTQDRFIYAKPQDDLIGADVEMEAPPEIFDGSFGNGGYDPWVDYGGGGGGGGGSYERELPGGFGLINWRVATG